MAHSVFSDEQIVDAKQLHGSNNKAAEALGIPRRTFDRHMIRLSRSGFSPDHDMTHTVPAGFRVKGTSTLYDKEGKVAQQWVKSQIDPEKMEALVRSALAAMAEELPRAAPVPLRPARRDADLLNCYIITDYHFGMLSWKEETGEPWDMAIAEDVLVRWFEQAIAQSPAASVGVLAQLGDFLHWDGMDAVTPASKHVLDADTRFPKLVRVAIRALRRIVSMLLEKHERVHILQAEGNHDPASSIWLRELFAVVFEGEPRVTTDCSADPYYLVEHGKTALFFHHGHKRKPEAIDSVFVGKFREVFGRTKHAYAHTGHMHHKVQLETNLMVVEQHRTLAAKDAYASRGGWLSGRSASCITYHAEHGEVSRVTISPDMIGH